MTPIAVSLCDADVPSVLFSGFAFWCAQYNNTQQSTTFSNQTPECSPLYYYYTALHVSVYRQAIIRCYLTILYKGQVISVPVLCRQLL
jgi:hypothetical protein